MLCSNCTAYSTVSCGRPSLLTVSDVFSTFLDLALVNYYSQPHFWWKLDHTPVSTF